MFPIHKIISMKMKLEFLIIVQLILILELNLLQNWCKPRPAPPRPAPPRPAPPRPAPPRPAAPRPAPPRQRSKNMYL